MTLTSTTSYTIQDKGSPFWHKLEDPTCTKDKQEQGAQNRSVLKLAAQMSKQMVSTIVQSCNKTRIKVCSNPSFQNCMQNCKPSNTHPSELKTFARCGRLVDSRATWHIKVCDSYKNDDGDICQKPEMMPFTATTTFPSVLNFMAVF